jgi:hypothetical protein
MQFLGHELEFICSLQLSTEYKCKICSTVIHKENERDFYFAFEFFKIGNDKSFDITCDEVIIKKLLE